ncbi:MAG: lactate racemase domain-containing protein [Gemmatirosa sp.]
MTRVPVLAGTRVEHLDAPESAVVLRPPPPAAAIDDIGAAVRDALRFPLAGPALEQAATRGGRATVVVEPPALPLPGVLGDPRRAALEATIEALVACGIPSERQTLLVAAGLAPRPRRHGLELLVSPDLARRFRGSVEVHDVGADDLVEVGTAGNVTLRVNRCLVETDLVVTVSAAETVCHGGPGVLLAAGDASALRAGGAYSLLETGASQGWRLGVALERALAGRAPVLGVSLALNHPVLRGALQGYPHDTEALERLAGSALGRVFGRLPSPVRLRILRRLPVELTALGVYAGPPSVAHAEALLRATEVRGVSLPEPVDVVCVGVPETTPWLPRERPNPVLAAALGLGNAQRLSRDRIPVAEGGTAILVHRLRRRFPHPGQLPYRAFFQVARDADALAEAEDAAARDERMLEAYRRGEACHPILPYVDWRACATVTDRLGAVLVAGCRDATVARSLGFIPTHGLRAAMAMAEGRAGAPLRMAVLPSPPYVPVRVGPATADS